MRIKTLLCFLLLWISILGTSVLYAATVTNHGNTTQRVQYFSSEDSRYHDLYIKPNQTLTIPGGTEKVKLVRDYGEWAQPPKPGEVINISIMQGNQTVGAMTWYGDKVFFDQPTQGPPPAQTLVGGNRVLHSGGDPAKVGDEYIPRKPWPWYGNLREHYLLLVFIFLMVPFGFVWLRSLYRPGFGRGPAFGYGNSGCSILLAGLLLGLLFGIWGFWGYAAYAYDEGFLPLLARDLYWFPLFLGTGLWHLVGGSPHTLLTGIPHFLIVIPFWMILCGLGSALIGRIRAPSLYSLILVAALIPFLTLSRGCGGMDAYAFESSYSLIPLYPAAFGSLLLFPLIFILILNFMRPYDGCGLGEDSTTPTVLHDRPLYSVTSGGCAMPILGILIGLLFAFLGIWGYWEFFGDGFGMHYLFSALARLPLILGLPGLSYVTAVYLFWITIGGGIGWCFGRYGFGMRSLFLLPWTLALMLLMALASSIPPGQDFLNRLDEELFWMERRAQLIREGKIKASDAPGFFGDSVSDDVALGDLAGMARDILHGDAQPYDQYQHQE